MRFRTLRNAVAVVLLCAFLTACAAKLSASGATWAERAPQGGKNQGMERYLSFVDDDADTVDPQCTSEYYTIALNVFDRLVEIQAEKDGTSEIVPSLADSREISPDGLTYRFHLHEGVTFSNGSPLTSSDIRYTLTRLLTHPDAENQDVAMPIRGAEALHNGKASDLAGFYEEHSICT